MRCALKLPTLILPKSVYKGRKSKTEKEGERKSQIERDKGRWEKEGNGVERVRERARQRESDNGRQEKMKKNGTV